MAPIVNVTIKTTMVKLSRLLAGRPGNLAKLADRLTKVTLDSILRFSLCNSLFSFSQSSLLRRSCRSSAQSRRSANSTDIKLRTKRRPERRRRYNLRQARQDLNPQPLVLETRALPIELLAYVHLCARAAGRRCRYNSTWHTALYFVSRCKVCLRQRGQNLFNSIRPGSLRRFFSVV